MNHNYDNDDLFPSEDDFKQLADELNQLVDLPPAKVSLSALEMFCIITNIQVVVSQAKNIEDPMTQTAIYIGEKFQNSFDRNSTIYKFLVKGWFWNHKKPTN